MAKINVPCLVFKTRGAKTYAFWQPSATLRKAGWKSIALGTDLREAQRRAEAQNEKIAAWRDGGEKPRAVKKFLKGGTVDQLIARFDAEHVSLKRENTQREYRSKLRIIAAWAGPEQVDYIDRARCRKLREALLRPDVQGNVKLDRAHATFRVLRTLFNFAIDNGIVPEGTANPADRPGIPTPPPRHQVWAPDVVDMFVARARAQGGLSLALAMLLAREIGQREDDLLKLSISQWVAIPRHKLGSALWDQLAEPGPDGTRDVRGIRIRQGKTARWIEVPVVGTTRALIDQAVIAAKASNSTMLLREEGKAQPWTATRFQRAIAALRSDCADAVEKSGDSALAIQIRDIQFRDLRRTAVVWLGELGIEDHLISAITGHSLDETKKILETYMPRTTKMAARAIALRVERDAGETEGSKRA